MDLERAIKNLLWIDDDIPIKHKLLIGITIVSIFTVLIALGGIINLNRIAAHTAHIDAMSVEELKAALKYVQETKGFAVKGIITLTALIIAANFFLVFRILGVIVAPVKKIEEATLGAASGDLTKSIHITRRDELGRIAEGINEMISGLRNLVAQVQEMGVSVASTAQELAASSEEMNASTEQVSSTVAQIATGAQAQAQQVEKVSQEMRQLSENIRSVAENAKTAAENASKAEVTAEEGGKSANEAAKKISEIQKIVSGSAEKVKGLGDRSKQINKVVDVITNIADQTNLLALNAAIEAARAGEHGRGFAVVAEEVRKLAEGSAKAAEQIAEMIKEIRDEIEAGVKSMDKGSEEVTLAAGTLSEAFIALEDISEEVKQIAAKIIDISKAAQEQKTISESVVKSIDVVASAAEEAAAGTEETSAAAEEQTASMQEMSSSAQELANLANKLQEAVQKFKVDGAEAPRTRETPRTVAPKTAVRKTATGGGRNAG